MGIVFTSLQLVHSVITPWLTLQFLPPSITSALASTLNVDFPVQNSFNLFVDSWLSPLNLHMSLITRVLVLNFCSVSLSSHMILGSQGQSSQSCGTKFCLLGVLWIRINVSFPSHCQWSSFFLPNTWDFRVDFTNGILSLMSNSGCVWHRPGVEVDCGCPFSLCECHPSPSLPPWTRRISVLITRVAGWRHWWMDFGCWDGDVCASKNKASTENISIGESVRCCTRSCCVDAHESRSELEWAGGACTCFDDITRWVEVVEMDCETVSGINGCLLGEWYWKHARSTHLSNLIACSGGDARCSTFVHVPFKRTHVDLNTSGGTIKPGGLGR